MSKISNMNLPDLILASASPRRAEILTNVGWNFEKITADVDESIIGNETPSDYVQRLAQLKAETVAAKIEKGIELKLVLGADTIVVIDGEIIGKPIDFEDARRMLAKLSGRWHEVLTGIAIVSESATQVDLQRTQVKFAELSATEVEYLVENGSPLDKAGGYAVQGCAALFIEEIRGDYWNVVGLPINLVYRIVRKLTAD